MSKTLTEVNAEFAEDVRKGLTQKPKSLSSKYFYNAIGDLLFQKIMELDEYYLTRSEFEIFSEQKEEVLKAFLGNDESFRLVELGAGDGTKTKVLLEYFVEEGTDFTYSPIDISGHVLNTLEEDLAQQLPELKVEPIQGDYFAALEELKRRHDLKEVVLFLGSNIGNFTGDEGKEFLRHVGDDMTSGDLLFIGFDLMKDPQTILNAYNDKEGITAEFNLNLLDRINNELGGNFDRDAFKHYPTYDPLTGQTKSFLVSKRKQSVYIEAIDELIEFKANEVIDMEVSQKYSYEMIESFADHAGFDHVWNFEDKKKFFVDSLWRKR